MRIKILKMELDHFKGVRNASYEFDDLTDIFSKNGVGKTTIADAFYWVFANKNYELVSNPRITPNGLDEIESSVEITISIENVEYVCRKTQKTENKTTDGITKQKTTNFYSINSIEKSETQFKNYLKELNFDFDNFLFLSNPNAFMVEKPKDARNFLMKMCNSFTDRDIALKEIGKVGELADLLENYTLDEVEAMQKSSIRKINENIGKNGELIDAQINGIEDAKVQVNVMGIEDRKVEVENELEKLNAEQKELLSSTADKKAIEMTLQELKDKFITVRNQIKVDNNKRYYEVRDMAHQKNSLLSQLGRTIESDTKRLTEIENYIQKFKGDIENLKSLEFANKNCPTCNQPLPDDLLKQAKEKFENDTNSKIEYAESKIRQNDEEQKTLEKRIADNSEQHTILKAELEEVESEMKELKKTLIEDVNTINYEDYDELVSIVEEIEEKKKLLGADVDTNGIEIAEKKNKLTNELDEINQKLAQFENNKKIDERIAEYRQEKLDKMQEKANAEKLLHQIDVLKKAKNEVVVDEINSHFELVKWKLFDYFKNGEYKEVCIPTINGKDYTQEVNTGLQIRARLDIIKGLQKYFDYYLPIFIDNAESLDLENKGLIDLGTQTIFLTVSEDTEIRVVTKENENE